MPQHVRALVIAALVLGCTVPAAQPAPPTGVSSTAPVSTLTPVPTIPATPAPTPTRSPRPEPPVAAADPAGLAAQITLTEKAVRDPAVTGAELAWTGHLQQLTYRTLSTKPEWRAGVLDAIDASLRATAIANLDAGIDLRATVNPGPNLPTAWRIVEPAPMDELLRDYRAAEAEFGVPWPYLAAIHLVETRMGRIRGTSVAGAQGPMQFMPSTWAAYGEGDINTNRDAIRAAARYLRANGAPGNMANALFRYNPTQRYVRAITAYAEIMRAEPEAYRGYYHWQVYYLTTRGDTLLPVGYGS